MSTHTLVLCLGIWSTGKMTSGQLQHPAQSRKPWERVEGGRWLMSNVALLMRALFLLLFSLYLSHTQNDYLIERKLTRGKEREKDWGWIMQRRHHHHHIHPRGRTHTQRAWGIRRIFFVLWIKHYDRTMSNCIAVVVVHVEVVPATSTGIDNFFLSFYPFPYE